MKKKLKLIFIFIIIGLAIFFQSKVQASTLKNGIANFPSDYQPYLQVLTNKHPKWKFIALYTDLDWNYVINEENKFGKNLVPLNYSDNWKNTTPRTI